MPPYLLSALEGKVAIDREKGKEKEEKGKEEDQSKTQEAYVA